MGAKGEGPMPEHLYAAILAGGGGTRFWPLSRRARPKQLLRVVGKRTLLEETCARLAGFVPPGRVLVVTGADQAASTREALVGGGSGAGVEVLAEPEGRDTAAAIGFAAEVLRRRDREAVMAVLPADHVVRPAEQLQAALAAACDVAERTGALITFGIPPDRPATGYGYIHRGKKIDEAGGFDVYRVRRFVEKPDLATAEAYLEGGEHDWNSGMFVWRAARILEEIKKHLPAHAKAIAESVDALEAGDAAKLAKVYASMKKVSIDFGVMEKAKEVAAIRAPFAWDDVGAWGAVARLAETDADGLAASGDVIAIDTRDCVIHSAGPLVTALGVRDLVIVATEDAVLVCDRSRDEDVRRVVERLREEGREELL